MKTRRNRRECIDSSSRSRVERHDGGTYTITIACGPYDGTNYTCFKTSLKSFNEVATAFNYTEDQCLRILPLLLRGAVRIKSERLFLPERSNWRTLVTHLNDKFPADVETAREHFHSIKQLPNETVKTFVSRVDSLAGSAFPNALKSQASNIKAESFTQA